jgi:hypothetical protein
VRDGIAPLGTGSNFGGVKVRLKERNTLELEFLRGVKTKKS